MQICYRLYQPFQAHLFATYLRHNNVPAHVINEASYIIGYAWVDAPVAILVPDDFAAEAESLIKFAQENDGLPEDIEIVYEDLQPPPVSPFECALSFRELLAQVAFVIFALVVLSAATFLAIAGSLFFILP